MAMTQRTRAACAMVAMAWVCAAWLAAGSEASSRVRINNPVIRDSSPVIEDLVASSVSSYALDLAGPWHLTNSNGSISITANVPGVTHTDLYNAGVIGDPYYRFGDRDYLWVSLDDWTYTRSFSLDASATSQSKIVAVFEGLDTVAQVSVNGMPVGQANNMFRRYVFNITAAVRTGSNTITVAFQNAEAYARHMRQQTPYWIPYSTSKAQHGLPWRNFIRKAQCHFSWDWGPTFLTQGIWLNATILAYSEAVVSYVVPQITQPDPQQNKWNVLVNVYLDAASAQQGIVTASITPIHSGTGANLMLQPGENLVSLQLQVSNVKLWWPRGYGEPNRYELVVTFTPMSGNAQVVRQWIGFRNFRIVQEPIPGQIGLTFYFEINNLPIFAKGANWIPADAFESRVNATVLRGLLQSAVDANMNIIRVWGGGVYQHEPLYQMCDEFGLMVWQEFMFACAMYPRDSAFLDTVTEEVRHQVRRLSYHPSIMIWSANNENEAALGGWYYETRDNPFRYVVDYEVLYTDTVRATLLEYDTTRPYLPSSPSNGVVEEDPYVMRWGPVQDEHWGDVHYYNYDALCTDVSTFPKPRFASEYGFQAFPSLITLSAISEPSDWAPTSPLMVHRQHHTNGTQQLMNQMAMHFTMPQNSNSTKYFNDWIYLTQCVQTMCIKTESEHYRRGKGEQAHTMGALYWQLNDIWQAPTWSSIEYGGRWKMLHYAAVKFFAPTLISSFETSYDNQSVYHVHVTSDVNEKQTGVWEVIALSWSTGAQLFKWTGAAALQPLQSLEVFSRPTAQMLQGIGSRSDVVFYVSWKGSATTVPASSTTSDNYYYLTSFAEIKLPSPVISASFSQPSNQVVQVTLTSTQMAPFVWLQTPVAGKWSDNGVLLRPNVPMNLSFFGTQPFTMASFKQDFSILTVRNTY